MCFFLLFSNHKTRRKSVQDNEKYSLNLFSLTFLVLIHILAIGAFLPENFSWGAVWLFFFLYWLTASVGICLGFHRLLTHRSLVLPRYLERLVVLCGVLACENGPVKWVAQHRMHHKGSDTIKDPHNAGKGFWWAHFGWMCYRHEEFDHSEVIEKSAADIYEDAFFRALDHPMVVIGIQALLGEILLSIGGWPWVFWGIFLRLVVVWHATWLVNSAAHYFGYQNFDTGDLSTNCWWVGLLAWGEGWHNNHHALPRSARHGLRWFEIDMTWWLICILKKWRIATRVHTARLAS
ncbi:MAG: fatty acid desaturase [Candidatus Lloydbacteria bacterium]|nr:fatty acid desaturase [Candidatus Lloydbacteria bacterium]